MGISRSPGRYKVTVLAGMPPVIHTLTHSEPGTENDLRTARVIISGGGQLLPSVWEAFDKRFHIPVANSYGLSETIVIGSGTTTLPEYPALTRNYQSVGVAVGYTEVRIVDADDPEKELGYRGDRGDRAAGAIGCERVLEPARSDRRGLPARWLVFDRGHRAP